MPDFTPFGRNDKRCQRAQIKLEICNRQPLHTGAYLTPERPPEPSAVETLAKQKRIGEMTPVEYLKLVREAQKALAKPR